jgi:hypothetical protein
VIIRRHWSYSNCLLDSDISSVRAQRSLIGTKNTIGYVDVGDDELCTNKVWCWVYRSWVVTYEQERLIEQYIKVVFPQSDQVLGAVSMIINT